GGGDQARKPHRDRDAGVLAGALRRARLAGSGLARRTRASTRRPWTRGARRPPPHVASALGRQASSSNPQLVRPRPLYTAADKRPALAYKGRPCRSRPPKKRRHEVARELARQGLALSAWAAPRRWSIQSASSPSCAPRATSCVRAMRAPTPWWSTLAAFSTAPRRSRLRRSAKPWPRTARLSSPAALAPRPTESARRIPACSPSPA